MLKSLDKKTHAMEIVKRLKNEYPNAKTALRFSNPFELLVATILSAQCTDKKVNEVTETLFKKYRSAEDFINVSQEELEQDIRPTGFYRNKAKNVKGAAQFLVERFNGVLPRTIEEMIQLPGVARKTANVVLGNAYGVVEGIAVDTHVKRISNKLGLSPNSDPEKIERDLMELLPKDIWFDFTHLIIDHGRAICDAKKPKCEICILNDICPSAAVTPAASKQMRADS
jgi:endonuclease-3